jgi:hypothetical protein
MYGRGKSDPAIVAEKLVNKAGQLAAESVERRAEAKRNADQQNKEKDEGTVHLAPPSHQY